MKQLRVWLIVFVPVLCLALLTTSGCGEKKKEGVAAGGDKGGGEAPAERKEAKVLGYTTLKGRVTYDGGGAAEVKMAKVTKDNAECGAEVPAEGWYVDESKDKKGVRYALVFLKAPAGIKMPKAPAEADKPDPPVIELRQPKCQFTPRVLSLHPKQELKIFNDSQPPVVHNTSLTGVSSFALTLPIGAPPTSLDPARLRTSNSQPYSVACTIHTGFMTGYIWKMDHPWAVVTDADGNYELKHVPVLDGAKMTLAVWHEMMKPTMKDVGPIDVEKDKPATKDFAIK